MSVRRIKLVFIGRGGVGKTCLVHRLQGSREFAHDNPATDGVGVGTLEFGTATRAKAEVSSTLTVTLTLTLALPPLCDWACVSVQQQNTLGTNN